MNFLGAISSISVTAVFLFATFGTDLLLYLLPFIIVWQFGCAGRFGLISFIVTVLTPCSIYFMFFCPLMLCATFKWLHRQCTYGEKLIWPGFCVLSFAPSRSYPAHYLDLKVLMRFFNTAWCWTVLCQFVFMFFKACGNAEIFFKWSTVMQPVNCCFQTNYWLSRTGFSLSGAKS